MNKTKQARSKEQQVAHKAAEQTREAVLDSLFEDMYKNRWKAYRLNFMRGIFLGLGSAMGGTIILAFLVWLVSQFIDWPLVSHIIENLKK